MVSDTAPEAFDIHLYSSGGSAGMHVSGGFYDDPHRLVGSLLQEKQNVQDAKQGGHQKESASYITSKPPEASMRLPTDMELKAERVVSEPTEQTEKIAQLMYDEVTQPTAGNEVLSGTQNSVESGSGSIRGHAHEDQDLEKPIAQISEVGEPRSKEDQARSERTSREHHEQLNVNMPHAQDGQEKSERLSTYTSTLNHSGPTDSPAAGDSARPEMPGPRPFGAGAALLEPHGDVATSTDTLPRNTDDWSHGKSHVRFSPTEASMKEGATTLEQMPTSLNGHDAEKGGQWELEDVEDEDSPSLNRFTLHKAESSA